MKFHNIQQNTEEWHNLRCGKITASHFGEIMAHSIKSGVFNLAAAWGVKAKDYAMRIAIERTTGKIMEHGFTNSWMERGHELEPIAREEYEYQTFTDVTNGGFICDDNYGASSDGLVKDGGVEIKSVKYNTHFERLIKGGFDLKHKWQIDGNIWAYNLQWIDFVSYCPEFPEEKQLYIFRVNKDEEKIKQLTARLGRFSELVNGYEKLIKTV